MLKKIGPGVLIAAAFIGPGTITACTLAGVAFGYALLWAMLLSVIATIVLQEMAARLGVITQKGLAEVIKEQLYIPGIRVLIIFMILAAIVIGNAAYEAGNIGGASLGLEALFGEEYNAYYPWIIGFFAFLLLFQGSYKKLERYFILLVCIMSISFILTAIITKPNLESIFMGLFKPTIPDESLFTILALVGTTVVPYNLFLHASLVREKWKHASDLEYAKRDTLISVAIGGIISMAIIITATSITGGTITNALDMAKGLDPLYGSWARYFMGIGLFAAGITSAVTAPLAAAYVVNSCFGWQADLKDTRFRLVWISLLLIGIISLSFGYKPIEIIQFAQVANGLLLPIIAILLIWIVNKASVLGPYRNTIWHNILAIIILAMVILLGAKSILKVLGIW